MNKTKILVSSFIFLLAIFYFPLLKADVVSVNSGGSDQICVNSGGGIEDCFFSVQLETCAPRTCSVLGYNCGSWSDGCSGTIDCGTCSSGYTCSSGVCTSITPPTPSPGGGGGGGGGAAGVAAPPAELKVSPEQFNMKEAAGTITTAEISITNLKDSELTVQINPSESMKDIIKFDDTSFVLGPGETKIISFHIISPAAAEIYTGQINILENGNEIDVPFSLNVYSGLNLFDISINVPSYSRTINIGDSLSAQINLIQQGVKGPMDVTMHYIIKDYDNNIYLDESETIMVNNQKTYEHQFNTQDLVPGKYIIGAEVIYPGGVATASEPFEISEKKITRLSWVYIMLIVLLALIMITILLILKYYKQQNLKYKEREKR